MDLSEPFNRYVRLLTKAMIEQGDDPDTVVHTQYPIGTTGKSNIPTAVWTKRRVYVTDIENDSYSITVVTRNPDGSEVNWTPPYAEQVIN